MIFRNIYQIIRRFKLASVLNILGMSIAFASFILIMMQVTYELKYNHCHLNSDRIFRIESCIGEGNPFYALSARPVGEVFRKSSRVENLAVVYPVEMPYMVTIGNDEDKHIFKENVVLVNSDYPKVFSFNLLSGTLDALNDPDKVLISESLAKKFFPEGEALGQILNIEEAGLYTVSGVYKDFPRNTTTSNVIYMKLEDDIAADDWNHKSFYMYALVDSPQSGDSTLFEALADQFDREKMAIGDLSLSHYLRLTNIRDTYYTKDVLFDFGERGSRQTTYLLICIAFIIILIAGINYTNFSTALTPLRIKNINTKKVFGSSVADLRISLVLEAITVSFFSCLIGVLLVFFCKGTFIEGLIYPVLDLSNHIILLITTCAISIIVGLLAGLYPSFYLTSFSPAMVLKGSFGLSPRGRRLRTILLCIQYIASIVLLSISMFMILQNKYMLHSSFGYDKEQIVTAEIPGSLVGKADVFFEELKKNENIEQAAYASYHISCSDNFDRWRTDFEGEIIVFDCMEVSLDFLKVLGINVYEGRNFLESDLKLNGYSYLFNQEAQKQYGLDLKKKFGPGPIVGFMPNLQYSTFRKAIEPMAFRLSPESRQSTSPMITYFRLGKNAPYRKSVDYILATLKQFDSDYPFEIVNLDSSIESAYTKEQNLSSLITLFSIMAILISLVGLFGLVLFETLYRRKEIGIRKVLGSTSSEIMKKFSFQYIRMILVCSVVAIPISYFVVSSWLESFARRTSIHWWVFVLSFIIISIVTFLTISYQNYRAAAANPVDSLKAE